MDRALAAHTGAIGELSCRRKPAGVELDNRCHRLGSERIAHLRLL
jgi:hypothetical protein